MKWYWILLVVLVVIYLSYYYRYPAEVAILQNTLSDMDLNALLQKQPIVVEDRVSNLQELAAAWFKYHYKTGVHHVAQTDESWARNRYRYLVIQPTQSAELMLYPPGKPMDASGTAPDPAETLLVIPLAPNQPCVLPLHWRFRFHDLGTEYSMVGVHDWLSWILP